MTDAEIIEKIATLVMGWTKSDAGLLWVWRVAPDDPQSFQTCRVEGWDPLTDPAASKQVREKLAELGVWDLQMRHGQFQFTFYTKSEQYDSAQCESDTEERAVALAALRTVGL